MHDDFINASFEDLETFQGSITCQRSHSAWLVLDWDSSKEEIAEVADTLGLTYEQVMEWKDYWMKFIKKPTKEEEEFEGCKRVLKCVRKNYREKQDSLVKNFNIFSAAGISADENRHSAILASLLSESAPKKGRVILQLFLEVCYQCDRLNIDPLSAYVSTEVRIGSKTNDEGGRIDILISSDGKAIIIENKIYAPDQENQIVRYYNFAKKNYPKGFVIFYLTLDGHHPSFSSCGNLERGKDFFCISYGNTIIRWLYKCQDAITPKNPNLYYSIEQYISIIKKMTMKDKFINTLCDLDHARDLSVLLDNKTQLEKKLISKYLIERIAEEFNEKNKDWEVDLNPHFYNNLKIAFRPKYWKQLGLWHVVQIVSGGCFYGLCVDSQEVKRGIYKQAPLRDLQNGSNEAFPFGWKSIPFSMVQVVDGTTEKEILDSTKLVMAELADDQRIDFGYFSREVIQIMVEKCTWIKAKDGSHEYICKGKCGLSDSMYELFVKTQRFLGVKQKWEVDNRDYVYFYLNGYKYWSMGDPIEETVIMNRVKDDTDSFWHMSAHPLDPLQNIYDEFTISPNDEVCLSAKCVWDQLDWDAPKEEVEEEAESYGITYEQAIVWKNYWKKYIKKNS